MEKQIIKFSLIREGATDKIPHLYDNDLRLIINVYFYANFSTSTSSTKN
jgi:hypothetical protein